MARPAAKRERTPLIYLDLRPFVWAGLGAILAGSPFLRGLFFAPDLLIVQAVLAVVCLLWLADRLLRREEALCLDLLDWAVLGFAAAYLLSLVHAVSLPQAVGGFLKALSYALLYFMVSRLGRGSAGAVRVLGLLFWAGVGVALVGVLAAAGFVYYPGAFDGKVMMSTFQYKNALAAYLGTAALGGLALQARRWRPVPLVLYSLGHLPLLVALFCSQSRGGWLVFPVAVLFYCLFLPHRLVFRLLYVFFLNLGVAVFVTRSYLPAVMAGQGGPAMRALLLGAVALAVAHLAVCFGDVALRRRMHERMRRAVAAGAVLYVAIIGVGYLALAGQAFPSVAGFLLPSALVARAQAIGGYEPNFQQRLVYDRDALRIWADYPLVGAGGGAWNALYHRYQDSQYFTTEVHNHFFQVAVEAGAVGLGPFGLAWVALVRRLVRLKRALAREEEEEEEHWPFVWAAGAAALALGVHSFFDFNLSLPALSFTLWALWGLVRAQEAPGLEPVAGVAVAARRRRGTRAASDGARETAAAAAKGEPAISAARAHWCAVPARLLAAARSLVRQRAVQAAVAACLALALLFPSVSFFRAGRIGAEAARAMEGRELVRARALYEEAHRLDPYTATYAADLAQVLTALGLAQQSESDLARARELAARAAAVEPHNPKVRAAASLVYLLQGYVAQAVAEAEAVAEANPWDVGAWEQLARAYVGGAQYYRRFGYAAEARVLLAKAQEIPARVEAVAARCDPQGVWQGPRLAVTPALLLARGQAACLLGQYAQALADLEVAYRAKALARETAPWLAVALSRTGRAEEAAKVLRLYPGAREEYERLKAAAPPP